MGNIVSNPEILGGKPIIENTRISVQHILELLSTGMNQDDIITEYPFLELNDINAALKFASSFIENDIILDLPNRKGA